MSGEPGRLGVVVVNWNQADDTIPCVRTLLAASNPPPTVWVVDNASREGETQRIAASCPGTRLITNRENLGFGGANNRALEQALEEGCEAILVLNNDARIDGDNLARLKRSLDSHPRLAAVGPVVWDASRPRRLLSAGGRDIGLFASTHLRQPPPTADLQEVDYVPGSCALLRAAALRTVGLFDERYFFSGEMADLCARARQQGWTCAVHGAARASHRFERSAGLRQELYLYYEFRNRYLFVRKFHPERRRSLFVLWTWRCGVAVVAALRRRDWPRARALRLAGLDGWAGRFGGQNARVSRGRLA